MSICDPVAGPVAPASDGPCSAFCGDGRSDRCAWCDHTRQSHPDFVPEPPGSYTGPCRYTVSGFHPRRSWLGWQADGERSLTLHGLAERLSVRTGQRSVALRENRPKRTERDPVWHLFGPEYHHEGCTHEL